MKKKYSPHHIKHGLDSSSFRNTKPCFWPCKSWRCVSSVRSTNRYTCQGAGGMCEVWQTGGTFWLNCPFAYNNSVTYFMLHLVQGFKSIIKTRLSISSQTMQEGNKSVWAVGRRLSLIFPKGKKKKKTSAIIVELFRECHIHLGFSLILKWEHWTRWPWEGLRDDTHQRHLERQSPRFSETWDTIPQWLWEVKVNVTFLNSLELPELPSLV